MVKVSAVADTNNDMDRMQEVTGLRHHIWIDVMRVESRNAINMYRHPYLETQQATNCVECLSCSCIKITVPIQSAA
jgi:hypothetical protein